MRLITTLFALCCFSCTLALNDPTIVSPLPGAPAKPTADASTSPLAKCLGLEGKALETCVKSVIEERKK
ncbi:MAG: hypothetical protein DHS20C10_09420 [marine bacterium B5-7]|nr:MAG: hypothetical protein DHS20C10_09420 [marine bacterium B5-7]